MARLEAPVTNTRRVAPAASASSTAYWISGLSTTGSISFGLALVAGRKRVPRPATGNTAVRITDFGIVLIKLLQQRRLNALPSLTENVEQGTCRSYRLHDRPRIDTGVLRQSRAFGPFEHRRMHAVPRSTFGATPIPPDTEQAAVIALITASRVSDPGEQRAQRHRIRSGFHVSAQLTGDARQPADILRRQRRSQQPDQLACADSPGPLQTLRQLAQHVGLTHLLGQRQHSGNDLERQPRRDLQG